MPQSYHTAAAIEALRVLEATLDLMWAECSPELKKGHARRLAARLDSARDSLLYARNGLQRIQIEIDDIRAAWRRKTGGQWERQPIIEEGRR